MNKKILFELIIPSEMATSTSGRKSKKTSTAKDSTNSSDVSIKRSVASEEEIREKAREIYHQRIDRGEDGTPEKDWLEAEAFLSESEV